MRNREESMRKLFVLAGLALTALLALSAPAAASSTPCNTTLTGATIPDDLVVPENGECIIINSTVGDDVRVGKNAFFQATNSDIGDDVTASRSAGVFIHEGSSVGGDVNTRNSFTLDVFDSTVGEDIEVSGSASVHICGNDVADDIEVRNSGPPEIQVGDPGAGGCEGNTVGDDIEVERNKVGEFGVLAVSGNTVADDLEVNHNRGTSPFKSVANNEGGDELECRGNEEPFTASGNTGWNETEGQCAIPPTECNSGDTPVTVNVPGDLVVPENGVCVITGSTVGGNVFVGKGGFFQSSNSQIAGDVRAKRSNGLFLDIGTTVGDEVEASNTFTVDVFGSSVGTDLEVSRSSVHVHICGNVVGDDVEVTSSGTEIQVGDPGDGGCAANTVGDDIEVERNNVSDFGLLVVRGNTVTDDLEVNHNRGSAEKFVQNNTGGDRLECRGNEQPFVGAPNAGFAFVEGDQCALV
jgi:hypothetical protein